ncbi:hypothetical protein PVAP13_5NG177181 [Panicum virgatum]|uniref:Uncharacterized protein n=1 Tax=Panicum virgatum TaxID=38727 RepID=A0A8T0RPF8_PANVG|nr:hypothetical protein PVAP13_5NG177181 [Panicum virgatum]
MAGRHVRARPPRHPADTQGAEALGFGQGERGRRARSRDTRLRPALVSASAERRPLAGTDVPSLRSRIRGERREGEGEGNPSRGVQAQGKEEREVGHGRHERHCRSSVAASIRACEVEIEGGRG